VKKEIVFQDPGKEYFLEEELDDLSSLSLLSCFSLSQEEMNKLASCPLLESLTIDYSNALTNLAFVESLKNLTTLTITRCFALNDLSPLMALKNLHTLNLASSIEAHISDMSPLSQLTSLRSLNLTNAKTVASLDFLLPLIHLEELTLDFCSALFDIHALSRLVHLKKLSMKGCLRAPLPPLEVVQQLTHFVEAKEENITSL
jgi:internalin A